MHALLLAGGFGQRLWPISRKNSPKQFSPILDNKSSLQLAIERLKPIMPVENIFISTNERYAQLLHTQFPEIPKGNFIFEPTRRDLAAAVGLSFFKLNKMGIKGPILLQWTDNYLQNNEALLNAVKAGVELVSQNSNRMIFLGETPRYASENLGYIEIGDAYGTVQGMPYYAFHSWSYRPSLEKCVEMVASGKFLWNIGYFVTTVEFMVEQYRLLASDIAEIVEKIYASDDEVETEKRLRELYPTIPSLHFDEAFLMRLKPEQAVLLKVSLGWSDPGNLYSLKESLQTSKEENVVRGNAIAMNTTDSLIINDEEKLVSVMGLDGIMVVNMNDVLLVIHKDSVRHIKVLLDEIEKKGKETLL